jgi:hypothetical protein
MAASQFTYNYKPLSYQDAQNQASQQLDPLYNRAVQNVNAQKYQNDVQSGQIAAARGLAHSGLAADMLNKNAIAAQGSVGDLNAQRMTQLAQMSMDMMNQDKQYSLQNRSQLYNEWADQRAWNDVSPAEKARMELQYQYAKKSSGGRGGGGGSSRYSGAQDAQSIVDAYLKSIQNDSYDKMTQASPKLDPTATSGLASQPGSYWYARGYGGSYVPSFK